MILCDNTLIASPISSAETITSLEELKGNTKQRDLEMLKQSLLEEAFAGRLVME